MPPTEPRVHLERPTPSHEHAFLEACKRSRTLHRGRVTGVTAPADYRGYLARAARPTQESFLVVITQTGQLAGAVDILDIAHDPVARGRLAYFAFLPHAGRGLMREGAERVIELSFSELGLVRVDADIEPGNERSRGLAARLGFRLGDAAPVQLKIGSRWRPHERWTLVYSDWSAADSQAVAARA